MRNEGWLPLGSCPVRFEGDQGWIETGDSGKFVLSSPALLAGRKVAEIGGYPATFHVRDFLNCVKSRGKPLANADVACYSHITCHAANIAVFLNRKLKYDPAEERVHRRRTGQSIAVGGHSRTVESLGSTTDHRSQSFPGVEDMKSELEIFAVRCTGLSTGLLPGRN